MSYYLEPWQLESYDALEEVVMGQRVAWTVDDEVYLHTGNTDKRDDGYEYIGKLEWEDSPNATYRENMSHNLQRLREFFLTWRQETGK